MQEETQPTETNSRSFGISIGVTESIYLLGLILLATGISLTFDVPKALIVSGVVLLITAFRNAAEREKGTP